MVLEKIPLLLLSLTSATITLIAQDRGQALVALENVGLVARLENAVESYATYILKTLWPSGLAALYPFRPAAVLSWKIWPATACLLIVSMLAVRWGRTRRYLPVGWFWFLGTLVPVIGLVRVGVQGRADRYTYLPLIGLFIMVIWFVGELAERDGRRRSNVLGASILALAVLSALTVRQVGFWKNDETLFRRTLSVTEGNFVAHNNLGIYLSDHGRQIEAIDQYLKALRIKPTYADAMSNLGLAYQRIDRDHEALPLLREALRYKPNSAAIYNTLGVSYGKLGMAEEQREALRTAIRLAPADVNPYFNLCLAYLGRGERAAALSIYADLRKVNPDAARNLQRFLRGP